MKNTKTYKVVMLPTEKASKIAIDGYNYTKIYCRKDDISTSLSSGKNQHLYITSDEDIKGGDYLIFALMSPNPTVGIVPNGMSDYTIFKNKIVATTDKSLGLPLIHDSFLPPFVKSYNEGKTITEIDLEIEHFEECEVKEKIKVRSDNTVIIHQSKTYTQKEVDELLDKQASQITAQVLKNTNVYTQKEVDWLLKERTEILLSRGMGFGASHSFKNFVNETYNL